MRRRFRSGWIAAALLGTAATVPAPVELPAPFPESITSTADGTLYIGSTAGGISRARPGATRAEPFVRPGAYGSRSVFGVLADPRHGTLWACSNDLSAMGIAGPPGGDAGGWLKGFDLETGAGKVSLRLPGAPTWCNDIAVARDGSVYVTNTQAPEILRLAPGGKALEVWLRDRRFQAAGGPGLDGIAVGGDGSVYVTTLRGGGHALYRIAVAAGKAGAVTKLESSRLLVDPDGLRPIGGDAFALIEGEGRLDRITIRGDRAEIETLREGLAAPTGVTLVGGTAWYVEGQLSFFFDAAKRGQSPPVPFRATPMMLGGGR